MKQLTCEMCGGTDLMKQDGAFVCQSCGMKYSVEEAKKMMIEGTVEVQGNVQVSNAAQLENLLQLAYSSYESKNYAQAEEFCNQVIAINSNNYDAWKLKGESINFQITGTNDRITEVYNCIMTSYKVLDEAGKEEYREEILESLRSCLEGEIDFALDLFKNNRPSDNMLNKVKNTFINCAGNVIISYEELGYSEEEADAYRTYIKNYFINKVNSVCAKTWDEVVYYNYYREGWNDDFHPTVEIMKTYINEGDNLCYLLRFATEYFTDKTPISDKRENYRLQNFFQRRLVTATSFKRMVSTTTNGYGAVISKSEYWAVDKKLTDEAIANRNKDINRTCALFDATEIEMAKEDPEMKKRLIAQWKKEVDSLDFSGKMGCGWTFSIALWTIFSLVSFIFVPGWCDGFEWFGIVCGVIFGVGAIACYSTARKKVKETLAANQAKADRLSEKIKKVS